MHRRCVIEVMQRYTQVKAAAEDDVPLALVANAARQPSNVIATGSDIIENVSRLKHNFIPLLGD